VAPESRIIAAELFLVLRKTNEPVSPFLWEREKAEKNTTASTGSPLEWIQALKGVYHSESI
jgi:hypothetical protein